MAVIRFPTSAKLGGKMAEYRKPGAWRRVAGEILAVICFFLVIISAIVTCYVLAPRLSIDSPKSDCAVELSLSGINFSSWSDRDGEKCPPR